MAIPMNSICAQCIMGRHVNEARALGTEEQATAFAKGLMQVFLSLPEGADSSGLGPGVTRLYMDIYGLDQDRYREEKERSNAFALERLPKIYGRIKAAADPVYTALQLSVLGNYLDFAALAGKVSFDKLDKMLTDAANYDLSGKDYDGFCRRLETAKSLLIITDNAGEVVFDRVLAETLKEKHPHLEITFLVRGGPANNDATRADAEAVGISFPVVDSGVCIGGTPLDKISPQARAAMENSDIIIAKGMGNTESLYGCGLPVYYAFLVKCARLEQVFGKPFMTPMFVLDEACAGA